MRTAHPLHNPFINRFNDPVSRRHDDMQSYEYMVWLRERDQINRQNQASQLSIAKEPTHLGRFFASVFGLLVLILTFAMLFKVV